MTEIKYYWEDFVPGEKRQFGGYAVTKEEIIEFASAYDPQPIHLDEEAAKNSIVGGLCASGWQSCAMVMRMMCDEYLLESSSMAGLGIDEAKWRAPVRPGDILSVTREVLSARPLRSRPDAGLALLRHTALNQHGEIKVIIEGNVMFGRRHPGKEI